MIIWLCIGLDLTSPTWLDGHACFTGRVITYQNYEELVGPRPSLPVHIEWVALDWIAPIEGKASNGRRNVTVGKQEKKHESSRHCAKSTLCPRFVTLRMQAQVPLTRAPGAA